MDITGVISKSSGIVMDVPASLPNAQNQLEFSNILGKRTADSYSKVDEAKVRDTVETFIATTFVQPIFKELRSTNHSPPPFGPSKAEQQFQSLIDAQLARRMVHKSNWPLVDRMAQNMLAKVRSEPQNELEKAAKQAKKKELDEQLHGTNNQQKHLGRPGSTPPSVHSETRAAASTNN